MRQEIKPLHKNNFSQAKRNLKHLGTMLTRICRLSRIFVLLMGGLSALGAGISLVLPDLINQFEVIIRQNTLYRLVSMIVDLNAMDDRYVAAIGCTFSALSFFVLSIYIRRFQKTLLSLIDTEKPFTQETAREIRRKSVAGLIMLFYNPVVGGQYFSL